MKIAVIILLLFSHMMKGNSNIDKLVMNEDACLP